MPVEVVIGRDAIPAAVLRFECIMRPPNTGIGTPNDDILSREALRPNGRGISVGDSRLDRRRRIRLQRRFQSRPRLRKRILNLRVALDACHVRASSQRFRDLPAALH